MYMERAQIRSDSYFPQYRAGGRHGSNAGSNPEQSTTPFTAEKDFLPTFERICCDFPRLKVAFEHCTTREAVEMVNSFGSNVAATITLHHLQLVCSDWIGKNHGVNYCRPVAKLPADRELLREQVLCGNKKFFLGTDSAPHTEKAKVYGKHTPAGVYTGANVAAYAAHILESFGALNNLLNFCQSHGAHFYDIKLDTEPTFIQRIPHEIPEHIYFTDEGGSRQAVAPFMAGEKLSWRVITGDCRDPDVCIP